MEADAEEFPVLLSNGNQKEKGAAESFDSVHKHVSETSNTQEFEQNKNAVLLPSAKIPRKEGTKRHFAVFDDPFPKPCYLFALVAGKLACQEDVFHNVRTEFDSNAELKVDYAFNSCFSVRAKRVIRA